MVQSIAMAKDKTFNLRLDSADRARLDKIAEHYSAPAATAVRILIKKEYDRIVGINWLLVAKRWAREMNVKHFESRMGVFVDETNGKVVLYDNNPWSDDPARRDRQLASVRKVLHERGIGELGTAAYPESGEDAGYTVAVVFDAGEDEENAIAEAYNAAVKAELESA